MDHYLRMLPPCLGALPTGLWVGLWSMLIIECRQFSLYSKIVLRESLHCEPGPCAISNVVGNFLGNRSLLITTRAQLLMMEYRVVTKSRAGWLLPTLLDNYLATLDWREEFTHLCVSYLSTEFMTDVRLQLKFKFIAQN